MQRTPVENPPKGVNIQLKVKIPKTHMFWCLQPKKIQLVFKKLNVAWHGSINEDLKKISTGIGNAGCLLGDRN